MNLTIYNILCSICANVIYEVAEKVGNCFFQCNKRSVEGKVGEILEGKKDDLKNIEDGLLESFFKNTQVIDIINNYLEYLIVGKIKNVKAREKNLTEKEVLDKIIRIIEVEYQDKIVNVEKAEIEKCFKLVFEVIEDFFYNQMDEKDKATLFFINRRIDEYTADVDESIIRINEQWLELGKDIKRIEEKLKRNLEVDYVKKQNDYENIRQKYEKIIKKNYEKTHLYGFREYSFNDLYITPILTKNKSEKKVIYVKTEDENWRILFQTYDMFYIVGNAGYGKSLFLKNIINNFSELDLNGKDEYLVIYCDLKTFYSNGEANKKSICDFLQESIINQTGIGSDEITKEFISYFINRGRCLILFDALDEVPKDKREELHRKIISFFSIYNPNNKICITSRSRGFFPKDNIDIIYIEPLTMKQINDYLDKMIMLGILKSEDKELFMKHARTLIQQGFLDNFLILSLLISIFKAEKNLPNTKVELYRKCFDYVAKTREEEKIKTNFNWDKIYGLMCDSTFKNLAKLAAPNNKDIRRKDVEELLTNQYRYKENIEICVKEFMDFCASRTELFVLSTQEDTYRFFHRSFFEYFYAEYICDTRNVEKIYELLTQFDVDSEIFELTAAMLKESNSELFYQLLLLIIEKSKESFLAEKTSIVPFNILTLIMQIVDEEYFLLEYYKLVVEYIPNLNIQQIRDMNHALVAKYVSLILINDAEKNETFFECYKEVICKTFFLRFGKYNMKEIQKLKAEIGKIKGREKLYLPLGVLNTLNIRYDKKNPFYMRLAYKNNKVLSLFEMYDEHTFKDYLTRETKIGKKYSSQILVGFRMFNLFDRTEKEKIIYSLNFFS